MSETTTTDTEGSASCLVLEDDSPAGVPRARDIARVFADRLEPALAAETAETLALVVTELTTNALRHGGGRYTLELSAGPDMVNVAVSDLSREPPRMRAPDLNGGTGGFGWHMIRRLTCSVTTSRGPGQGENHPGIPPEMTLTVPGHLVGWAKSQTALLIALRAQLRPHSPPAGQVGFECPKSRL